MYMARIAASLRQAVLAEASGRCAYCHSLEQFMGVAFEVDHITPRSLKGRTVLDNLCLSCPTCNRYKASRSSARDPVSRRRVRLFHPKRDKWREHFKWSGDGSEIIGLTPSGRATVQALHFNRPAMRLLRRYWKATGIQLES